MLLPPFHPMSIVFGLIVWALFFVIIYGGVGVVWGLDFAKSQRKIVWCLRVGQRLQLSWPEIVWCLRVASPPDPQSPSNPQLSAHTLKLPLPYSHRCKSPHSLTGISGALWHDNV